MAVSLQRADRAMRKDGLVRRVDVSVAAFQSSVDGHFLLVGVLESPQPN